MAPKYMPGERRKGTSVTIDMDSIERGSSRRKSWNDTVRRI